MTERIGFYSRDEKYGWLSNFHRSTMIVVDKEYITMEHFYQSRKAIGSAFQEWIRLAPNPYLAMKAGRILRAGKPLELRADWENIKLSIMLVGLRLKFKDPELRKKLLDTGDAYLYEDSPSDTYWGLVNGQGENHLGKLIMKVRDEMKK
jgi:hypothetical protein